MREPFALVEGSLWVVPVCHYRMEFARLVREAIRHFAPDVVALELAAPLREPYLQAVGRFPHQSILVLGGVPSRLRPRTPAHRCCLCGQAFLSAKDLEMHLRGHLLEEAREIAAEVDLQEQELVDLLKQSMADEPPPLPLLGTTLLPVEPTDPFAEAVRTARELEIGIEFVDLAVEEYPEVFEPIPDSSSLGAIGLEAFYREYEKARNPELSPIVDRLREEHMAAGLQELTRKGRRVLLVCGMAHVRGVLEHYRGQPQLKPGASPPSIKLAEPDLDTIRSMSWEMPLVMTLYELSRGGPGPDKAWQPPPAEEEEPEPSPLQEISGSDAIQAAMALLGMRPMKATLAEPPVDIEVLKAVATYLNNLPDPHLTVANLLQSETPSLEGVPPLLSQRPKVFKFKQVSDRRAQLLDLYASINTDSRTPEGWLDRQRVLLNLCQSAGGFHHENTGETLQRWQFQTLYQYTRNYAALKGMLLPSLYELLMGARGVADDNYAYEVWDLGSFYPWSEGGDAETLHIDAEMGAMLGGRKLVHWRFDRRLPRMRQMRQVPGKGRMQEGEPGDWEKHGGQSIVSYPPEDLVIEDYGRYLQKKAITMLSAERSRVEPFSTSIMDGIDMRETIRNWHDQARIFVREIQRVKGGAGSVVLVFDDDAQDQRYPWRRTWHGEHAQESDMAFFATPPTKLVGPGIARCEYGGLMLTYPPRRLADVWSDPMYRAAQSKSEVLLFAAIDYCLERHVVYVAAKPPRTFLRTLASRLGKKIVYIPIGQLSPVSLKKIRVFHVLSAHRLRQIAKDYIW